jgi:hypothetical protein
MNPPNTGYDDKVAYTPHTKATTPFVHQSNEPKRVSSNRFIRHFGIIGVYVIVLVLAIFLAYLPEHTQLVSTQKTLSSTQNQLNSVNPPESQSINNNEYQAVFLNSGQVYFGKIGLMNRYYIKLSDIYYISSAQSSASLQSSVNATGLTSSDLQLIKLGCEVHAPEDVMVINQSEVSFWENIKNTGQVAQAIDKFASSPNLSTCHS